MPLTVPHQTAIGVGPRPCNYIGIADTVTGRITRRISPGKGIVRGLTASPDGSVLYFCAAGSLWAVPASGGDARPVSTGEFAAVDPSGRSLIVVRRERARMRMLQVPLDGAPAR